MANTFDTSRVGGGTYELEQDSNGNYALKSVGFEQVNKLNLPNLTNLDIPQATIGPITKLPVQPDVADPFKKLADQQGNDNRDRIISQNYERINPKDISVKQAGDRQALDPRDDRSPQEIQNLKDAQSTYNTARDRFGTVGGGTAQDLKDMKAANETIMSAREKYRTETQYNTPKTTGLQDVKSKVTSAVSNTVKNIMDNSATVMVAKGAASILKGIANAMIDPYQQDLNKANKNALTSLGYKTNFELGLSTDPGRIAGNPADNVFAGMNAQSAKGDISKGASKRIETRTKTAMKKAGTWSKEKLDKFNAKTEKFKQQKAEHDAAAAKDKAQAQAAKDNRAGVGGSCFIAGTKVTMSDGTLKNIENIVVGDKVKGHKEDNTVIKLDPTLLADRKLYSFNNSEHYFFTSEHPFMTEEGWKSIKPEKTKERDGIELYEQLKGELKVGDKLVTDNGSVEIKDIKSKEISNPEMPLYNFNVSNDNSYIADNYVVHNKGCFIKGTLVTMADGSTKPVEQVDLGDEVAEGGSVFAVGRFLNTELYDYKGIKVSGSHMVNENGTWMRVKDTKHGKSLGNDLNTVYVFGSENRRILINGILFTDYFEVNEQDKLIEDSEDFFNNWKSYGNTIDEHNVNTLNGS